MKILAIAALLVQFGYGGPPMWQQMPPDGAFDGPPGAMMPDGPAFGPGSPYNAPGMGNPDGPRPGWMDNAPPVPSQGPMGPPGNPWDDGGLSLIQYGPPMWQQVPPWDAYAPPHATGRDDPDGPRPGWDGYAPHVPYQEPPYLGVRPGGNMDGDGDDMNSYNDEGYVQIQWGGEFGDSGFPPFGGPPPRWYGADPRDRYGEVPADRFGDHPPYWNAYPQPGAPQPMFPTGPGSPYEDAPWGNDGG